MKVDVDRPTCHVRLETIDEPLIRLEDLYFILDPCDLVLAQLLRRTSPVLEEVVVVFPAVPVKFERHVALFFNGFRQVLDLLSSLRLYGTVVDGESKDRKRYQDQRE